MGKLRVILLFLSFFCVFASCGKPEAKTEEEEKVLSLQYSETVVSSSNNVIDFTVQSNCEWCVKYDVGWISIVPDNDVFNNSGTLQITVEKNSETSRRIAELSFIYGEKKEVLVITQEAFDAQLEVSAANIEFGYRAAEKTINVTSNCGWFAKASEDWVAIKPSTGLIGRFDMEINIETNPANQERQTRITIWNDDYQLERVVEIHQSAHPDSAEKEYVDEYGNNWGKGIMIRGLLWAPVNCGYHFENYPLGKMYQWGRRFGQGYQDGVYKDILSPTISGMWLSDNGKEDPTTFYLFGEDSNFNYDWIKEGNDKFWNLGTEENPQKNTMFDPCPDGWRIPTAFEYKSLIGYVNRAWIEENGYYGYRFYEDSKDSSSGNSCLFLPAGGRLNVLDGKAYDRNIEAYYWTNTAKEGNSSYLYFYNEDCNLNSQGSRAGGCLVRCVRE